MSRPVPAACAAVLALAGGAFLLYANRGTTFILDDWAFLIQRSDLSALNVFGSQNSNWYSTAVLVYTALAEVFGVDDYLPFRLTALALHLGCAWLVYVLARRRIGAWWALLPMALVLVTRGWEVLLWPFQLGQLASILSGLSALVLLEGRGRAALLGAGALLVASLASSSAGVPFVIAAAVELALSRRRALWLLALPAAAYGWWYLAFGRDVPAPGSTDPAVIRTVLDIAWDISPGTPASMLGTSFPVGRWLGVLALLLVVLRLVLERRLPGRLLGVGCALVAYWLLLAWGRSEIPSLGTAPRYVHLSVVLAVLVAVETVGGLEPHRWPEWARQRVAPLWWRARPVLAAGLAVLVARAVWLSADVALDDGHRTFRLFSERMLGQQAAVSVAGRALEPQDAFFLDVLGFQLPLPVQQYRDTLARFGGPTLTERALIDGSRQARMFADGALSRNYAPVAPAAPGGRRATAGLELVAATGVELRREQGCLRWRAASGQPAIEVRLPRRGLLVHNARRQPALPVELLRWSEAALGAAGAVPPGGTAGISVPRDGGSTPWRVRVAGYAGELCPQA